MSLDVPFFTEYFVSHSKLNRTFGKIYIHFSCFTNHDFAPGLVSQTCNSIPVLNFYLHKNMKNMTCSVQYRNAKILVKILEW